MSTVFMFSGQGSQYFHMGKQLYEGHDVFRRWMTRLDGAVREISGYSVLEELYSAARGKGDSFDRIALTHPAIFMVEYSLAQCLIDSGVRPDLVLGASLGSFAAAAVAGCFDAEEALAAVLHQAATVETHCGPGGMTAVLADPALFAEEFLCGNSELAAVNFASHFVVSAKQKELEAIEETLRGRKVSFQRLPVTYPFHSRWIDSARAPFESFMQGVRCKQGRIPVACCAHAALLSDVSEGYFWHVARRPIRFLETAAHLERQGSHRYIDVGPAGTLSTFLKYGLPAGTKSTVHSILTPFGMDQKNLSVLLAAARN